MLRIALPLLLAALFFGLPSSALPGSSCPDTQATEVPLTVTESGGTERCGVGLVIFGIGGGLFGGKCPKFETKVPAHQVCEGEVGIGTRCVPEQDLPVHMRECGCGGLVVPGLEIGIPTNCLCDDWGATGAGFVEDAETAPCSITTGRD